jgi:hypothetical protein
VLRSPASRLLVDDPGLVSGWRVACHLHDQQHRPDGAPEELAAGPGAEPDEPEPGGTAADTPLTGDTPVTADSAGGEQ